MGKLRPVTRKRFAKNALAFLGMLAALFVGIGLQIYFQQVRDAARIESHDRALYSRATGTETALGDAAAIQSLTMASSLVIVAVNMVLSFVAKELSVWQKFSTQSDFEASLMLKLTVVHVINSILVPAAFSRCPRANIVPSGTDPEGGDWYGGNIYAPSWVNNTDPSVPGGVESATGKALMADNGKCLWYAPGGLVETAFYLQLFNALVPNVIAYVDVFGQVRRKYLARHARTQTMMDHAADPPDFILATKYAAQCKTVALAMVYGPILPVSYALALFALFTTYFTDKILALKRCKKPVRQQNQATERVVLFMNVMALVQFVFSGFLFYDLRFPVYVLACAALWVLYQALPLNRWLGIVRDATTEDGGTGDLAFWSAMGKAGGKGRAPGRPGRREREAATRRGGSRQASRGAKVRVEAAQRAGVGAREGPAGHLFPADADHREREDHADDRRRVQAAAHDHAGEPDSDAPAEGAHGRARARGAAVPKKGDAGNVRRFKKRSEADHSRSREAADRDGRRVPESEPRGDPEVGVRDEHDEVGVGDEHDEVGVRDEHDEVGVRDRHGGVAETHGEALAEGNRRGDQDTGGRAWTRGSAESVDASRCRGERAGVSGKESETAHFILSLISSRFSFASGISRFDPTRRRSAAADRAPTPKNASAYPMRVQSSGSHAASS